MSISPNDNFTAGQILTATECNNFPRGVMALATSTTSYTLTTTETIATGMTVTFTPVLNRYYRITYFEPQAQTATFAANTQLTLRLTNATGTVLQNTIFQNESNALDQQGIICIVTTTFASAVSTVVVGTAKCSLVTGGPQLIRDSTRKAQLLIEDIGPA
jgi:hypothetical protein